MIAIGNLQIDTPRPNIIIKADLQSPYRFQHNIDLIDAELDAHLVELMLFEMFGG
jgi:hypothetical protein